MNPYYYLFYRLSRLYNRKGNNPIGPIGAISLLIGTNALVIYFKIFSITPGTSQGAYKTGFMALAIITIIANAVLFSSKKRVGDITNRFSGESVRSRRIGGFLVILYVVLTFAFLLMGS